MKVTRSEFDANEAQARTVVQSIAADMAVESLRRDWRAIVADRDDGRARKHAEHERAARNRRAMRRTHVRNIGRASVGMLATMATAAGAVIAAAARIAGAL